MPVADNFLVAVKKTRFGRGYLIIKTRSTSEQELFVSTIIKTSQADDILQR